MDKKIELIEKSFKKFDELKYSVKTMKTVLSFFEYCNYDLNKINPDSYYQYIFDEKIDYFVAYYGFTLAKNIMVDELNDDKEKWKIWGTSKVILSHINMEYETRNYLTYEDWENFRKGAEIYLSKTEHIPFLKNYIKLCFAWNTINPIEFPKIKIKDIIINGDIIKILSKKILYEIEDSLLSEALNKVFDNYQNEETCFLKVGNSKPRLDLFDLDFQDVYYSGAAYFLTKGKQINVSNKNNYLMPYLEAVSKYMYGENREE